MPNLSSLPNGQVNPSLNAKSKAANRLNCALLFLAVFCPFAMGAAIERERTFPRWNDSALEVCAEPCLQSALSATVSLRILLTTGISLLDFLFPDWILLSKQNR